MLGDIYNIKGRIKVIDRELDIEHNGDGSYTVTHKGSYFMKVMPGQLDDRVLKQAREVVWKNKHADILSEVESFNEKVESSKKKKIEDMAYSMAKDIHKPLREAFYY